MKLKYLGELGKGRPEPEIKIGEPFLDADKIVYVMHNFEVSVQAHPENNAEPLDESRYE